MYSEMERRLMTTMRTHDKGRFRVGFLSTFLALVWVLSVFGAQIRRFFGEQTAEVARETLRHESLQVQTQELATALVQTLLNDQEVIRAGALFLREASTDSETQAALVKLAVHILQHQETLKEVVKLAKVVVKEILADPDTLQQVVALSSKAMADEGFRAAAAALAVDLGNDQQVYEGVVALTGRVMADPAVKEQLNVLLADSSHAVLDNEGVLDHSKDFVAEVMADDAVQRSGGDALWNTVQYALQTPLMKAVGFGLLSTAAILLGKTYGGGWGGGAGGGMGGSGSGGGGRSGGEHGGGWVGSGP